MKKFLVAAAAFLSVSLVATSFAGTAGAFGTPVPPYSSITGIVAASGGDFDDNRWDFDILLNAVQTAGLAETLDTPGLDVTVWAPNDLAFVRTARDLGYTGGSEEGAWNFLVGALTDLGGGDPIPVLTEILTYHVTPQERNVFQVIFTGEFPTLQGGTIQRNFLTLVDADPDLPNPNLTLPIQADASNGVIHAIDRVLIPIDL